MSTEQQLIANYFTHSSYEIKTLQTVNIYSREALSNVITDLAQGNLDIGLESRCFNKETLAKMQHGRKMSSRQQQHKRAIQRLEHEKEDTIERLHRIYEEQGKIRFEQHQRSPKKSHAMDRSMLSPEEKVNIKRLVKAREQFQQQLQEKTTKIMETVHKREKEDERYEELLREKKVKNRRKEILEHHKIFELQRRREYDAMDVVNSRKNDNRGYIYLENKKDDKRRDAEKEQYNTVILAQKRQRMKTDFSELKQHATEHTDNIGKRRLESEQAILQKSKYTPAKYHESEFMRKIKVQEEEKRIEQDRKTREKRDFTNKIKEYRHYVVNHFHPHSSEKSKFQPKKKTLPADNMSLAQRREVGNKYLVEARKMKKSIPSTLEYNEDFFPNPEVKSPYPNYLTKMHYDRTIKGMQSSSEEQLKKIMNRKAKLTSKEVIKALDLTKQIQKENKMRNVPRDQSQYDVVRTKLKLLEAIVVKR